MARCSTSSAARAWHQGRSEQALQPKSEQEEEEEGLTFSTHTDARTQFVDLKIGVHTEA